MSRSIQWSVGAGGRNLPTDVVTVQYLLNCVPAGHGGPVPELAVDGMAGPKTIAAIRKFQAAAFGWADGRVDPGGRSLKTLQPHDPYPNQPIGPSADGKTPGAPLGKEVADQKSPGAPTGKAGSGAPGGKSGSGTPWFKGLPGKGGAGGKTGF
jgi:peptidoglycan hydrolase-like protein with peptidoglycan-binding domain